MTHTWIQRFPEVLSALLMLLVDPSLNPVTWESGRCLLVQNTQPTGQWKGHTQLKEAGKEGKKKRGKRRKRPVGSFYAPADQHLYIKLLEHRSSTATLQPYSWRVHITCFPFESTFPRTLASWHGVGKLKGKKVFTFWRKHGSSQSPREMSTANGNEEEAMRHHPYCRKQPTN